MQYRHQGKVEKGKLTLASPEKFKEDFRQYEGETVYVSVRPFKPTRSSNQNRYYWAVIIKTLSEEIGYSSEEMHEILKQQFLITETKIIKDKEYKITKSTTALNTSEFEDYLSKIRSWASVDLGIFIPEPNDVEGY